MKSIRKILASMRNADQKFSLISPNDKIAVGISGGKDSLTLFYALTLYKRFSQKDFEIVPILLDLGFQEVDFTRLSNWFSSLGYELHIENHHEVASILNYHKKDKLPCSICSRMKKAGINAAAHAYGCNKVVFAHHADDAIETLWMNEIFGARIATFAPKMHLEKTDLVFIRPLILARESVIKTCAEELHLPITSLGCPNDKHTSREDAKNWLSSLYKVYPEAKENFLTMLTNYEKEDLWKNDLYYAIEGTFYSIRPVISISDFYQLLRFLHEIHGEDVFRKNYDQYPSFLLYEKDQPIGFMQYEIIEERKFLLRDLKVLSNEKKEEGEKILLSWLERELFLKANPCFLYVHEDCLSPLFSSYEKDDSSHVFKKLAIQERKK